MNAKDAEPTLAMAGVAVNLAHYPQVVNGVKGLHAVLPDGAIC